MPDGRELEAMLLRSPDESPVRGIARNLIYGSIIGIVLTVFFITRNGMEWKYLASMMIVGNTISFFGWGAERLWYATVSKMIDDPFSFIGYSSRVPFWYLAGGIAYALSVLLAKKAGFPDVADIPVKQLFDAGGRIGCAMQLPLQIMLYRKLVNDSVSN